MIGSLCSGAGGLDMAVERVFGAETVWHCETDPAASKVLAHRWPGVPNHGDLVNTEWSSVEPVDIVAAGWPCQPWSNAGKRQGAEDDRAIWPHIAGAIRILRPRFVCLENVAAVVGIGELWRVANDLSAFGYDLRWTCIRASDVGAPHRRERLFVVAADADVSRLWQGLSPSRQAQGIEPEALARTTRACTARDASDSARDGWYEGRPEPARLIGGSDAAVGGDGPVDLLPTPTAQSAKHDADDRGPSTRDDFNLWSVAARIGRGDLLPTPRTSDTNGAGRHGDGGMDLRTAVSLRLLPTPLASDCTGGGQDPDRRAGHTSQLADEVFTTQWGNYAPAIRRWEQLTRPAPAPTEPNKNGNPRLSAAFSEWLMGWPGGWVTDVPGISRNDQLRIIGNGVVPQQATTALSWLLSLEVAV